MGRFKIYDPLTLVDIEDDKNYARCLQCTKKLKNIMGNIKTHYERMHGKVFSQSKKRLKIEATDKPRKRGRPRKQSNTISQTCLDNIKEDIEITPSISKTRHSNRIFEQFHKTNLSSSKENEELESTAPMLKDINVQKTPTIKDEEEYKIITAIPKKIKSKMKNENIIEANLQSTENQSNSSPFQQIKKLQIVSLNMNRQEYLQCIAETITNLNMPIRYFDDDKGFQKLLNPWTRAFGIQFNSKTIIEHINLMATKIRADISKTVGYRFICLKLDIVSQNERSIMVLNIQFIKNFVLKVLTIGVLELLDDHFATYLKQQVLNTLERYKIDISKVYSITKDNGSNFKKSFKILQEFKENDISDDESDNYHEGVCNEFTHNLSEGFVGHSLHFVACNIIVQLNENISQSRDAVKSLRRQMVELNINPLPIFDNTIRWSSTYDMIKSLLNTRHYVENNQLIKVEIDWEFARKFEESFKPIVETMAMLQSSELLIGDFYREWLVCETELEELSDRNELAMYLLEAMRNQKMKLMENESFLAALYLDPRFCFKGSIYLSDKQKKTAILHLLTIFNKLKSSMENPEKEDESSLYPNIETYGGNERYEQLEKKAAESRDLLNRVKIEPMSFSYNEKATLSEVDCSWAEECLEQLQYEEKLTFNTNILYFWKTKSYSNYILAQIAEIILAVPATQVTIQRAFSALPVVLTKQKRNLNSENMESILLLKLNPELARNISFD